MSTPVGTRRSWWGGLARNLGTSARLGAGDVFVIEGDEYDSAFFDKTAKFLKYLPEVVVVNNLEFDHADIYRDLDELRLAFQRLVRLIPETGRLVLGVDDPETLALAAEARCPVDTFGLSGGADWTAEGVEYGSSGTRFTAVHGDARATVTLPMLGAFNVRNRPGRAGCRRGAAGRARAGRGGARTVPGGESAPGGPRTGR